MESKTLNVEKEKQNNFANFIKSQKENVELFPIGHYHVNTTAFTPRELFSFLSEHFNEFQNRDNLLVILAFIHRCVKVWDIRGDFLRNDVGNLMKGFLDKHNKDEKELNIAIQIIYQVLNSTKYSGDHEPKRSQNLLFTLITLLSSINSRNLISNIIACIQFYKNIFPENCDILINFWTELLQKLKTNSSIGIANNAEIDILIQLIDEFKSVKINIHNDPTLMEIIQNLLKSDHRADRKCAYYLLKKVLQYLLENQNTNDEICISQQIKQTWIMYITLLENLEEEQSHLILPPLTNLEKLIKSKHIQLSWLHILYIKILTHNNKLVLRWSIEFFLKMFSCSDLNIETLKYLLQATNSNLLYNFEGYSLNLDYISSFLNGNVLNLYKLLPEIENWKSVPLYIWLKKLNEKKLSQLISYELVLNISACVRKLQNFTIRENVVNICNQLFKDAIDKMSMEEYVTFVETLYNSSDKYLEHKTFFNKKSTWNKRVIFKKRFYEIFTNSICWSADELFEFLNDIPTEQHGWLKFAPFFIELSECNKKNIISLYKLDLNSLKSCNLCNIMKMFENCLLDSLLCNKAELRECHQAAISFYINEKKNMDNETEDTLRLILNTKINKNVLERLTKKLENTTKQFDTFIIDEFVRISTNNECQSLINYLRFSEMDNSIACKYMLEIAEKMQTRLDLSDIPYNLLQYAGERLLNYNVSKGETRIEQAFCFNEFGIIFNSIYINWLQQISKYSNEEYILFLLKYHRTLSKTKLRYFEHSYEHRVKLRIATGILYAFLQNKTNFSNEILDQIWYIILNENNQLNITYIYEYILGTYENRNEIILENLGKVHSLASSQQVSIILVAYNFSMQRCLTFEMRNKIISNFLSLTMGANFQTRLFAQISIYKLLKLQKFEDINGRELIIKSIECATGTKLIDYLNDIRMHIAHYVDVLKKRSDYIAAVNLILYITNAPFDEFIKTFNMNDYQVLKPQIIKSHGIFMKKYKNSTNDITTTESIVNDQLQRKMNPVNDLTKPSNLVLYPIKEKFAEIFVIASLIDKLPNLGGIARTCEVLGIQNLVIDSKMHTEKSDFKSLSMTAEKSLNIVEVKPKDLKEFLLNKKLEGFEIVGAEQTSNSQNFNNFKFPKKCVLLLGHEKGGISAQLLSLLDYAVEIPQFGQVRSLNVHVTGALFMWEYCKQHIIKEVK